MKYKVYFTIQEDNKVKHFVHTCDVSSEQQIIDFYGLEEPDVLEFLIEKI